MRISGRKFTVTFLYLVRKIDTHQCTFCYQFCLSCTLGGNSINSLHLFYWNIPAHILHCLQSIRLHLSKVKEPKRVVTRSSSICLVHFNVIILKKHQDFEKLLTVYSQRTDIGSFICFFFTCTTSRSSPKRSTSARVWPGAISTVAAAVDANCWQNKRISGATRIRLNDFVFQYNITYIHVCATQEPIPQALVKVEFSPADDQTVTLSIPYRFKRSRISSQLIFFFQNFLCPVFLEPLTFISGLKAV